MIENLSKKSEFFREKSLQLVAQNSENSGEGRRNKKDIEDHSSKKSNIQSLSRNLALQVKYFKNYMVKERMNIQSDLELCKKYIKNSYNLITLKLQEDSNHKSFLKRELILSQKNLKNYEKMLRDISVNMNDQIRSDLRSDLSSSNLKHPPSDRFITNSKYNLTERIDNWGDNSRQGHQNHHSPHSNYRVDHEIRGEQRSLRKLNESNKPSKVTLFQRQRAPGKENTNISFNRPNNFFKNEKFGAKKYTDRSLVYSASSPPLSSQPRTFTNRNNESSNRAKLSELRAENEILEKQILEDLENTPELVEGSESGISSESGNSEGSNSYLSFEETRKFTQDGTSSIRISERLASLREQERILKMRLKNNQPSFNY